MSTTVAASLIFAMAVCLLWIRNTAFAVVAHLCWFAMSAYAEFRYLVHWLRHPSHIWAWDGFGDKGFLPIYKQCQCGKVFMDLRIPEERGTRFFA